MQDSFATTFGGGVYSGAPLEIECPELCAGGSPKLETINSVIRGNETGGEGGGVYGLGDAAATHENVTMPVADPSSRGGIVHV